MWENYATRELTIRDTLCHRSGVGQSEGDLLFLPTTNLSTDQIISKIKYIKPLHSFRSKFAYNNLFFILAGRIIELVSGMSYGQFIKTKIFDVLGMTHSYASMKDFNPKESVSWPHVFVEDKIVSLEHITIDNAQGPGGLYSCVSDMFKWIQHLNSGSTKIVSQAQLDEIYKSHVCVPTSHAQCSKIKRKFVTYCLGVTSMEYETLKIFGHTGSILGSVSRMYFIPEKKYGFNHFFKPRCLCYA